MKRMLTIGLIGFSLINLNCKAGSFENLKMTYLPYLLKDPSNEYKDKIIPLLKDCGIDSKKVCIKEIDEGMAVSRTTIIGNRYLYVNPSKLPIDDAENFQYAIYHEVDHLKEFHTIKKRAIVLFASLLCCASTAYCLDKIPNGSALGKCILSTSMGLCSALYFKEKAYKFTEMEADLFALDKLCDKKNEKIAKNIVTRWKTDANPDYDDGEHPTLQEAYKYGDKFLNEKLAGKNPSIKKYAWNYILNEHTPKPISKIVQRFQKHN